MSANTYIPAHFPLEYDTNWVQLAQQSQSKLSPYVTMDSFEGKSMDFNQYGKVSFQSITSRAGETRITDDPLSKRRMTQGAYDKSSMFDEWDQNRLGKISLPRSETMVAHNNAWQRLKDVIIIRSVLGTAVQPSVDADGIETTQNIVLPNSQKVAIDYVESGSAANSGLTIGKLRQANYILSDGDIDEDEPRVLVVTAAEIRSLLRSTEIGSNDYNEVRALVDGKVKRYMGFDFEVVSSKDVLPAVNGVRYLPGWVKSGVKLSVHGLKSYVDVRADKSHALQIRHTGMLGGVRMEEVKVVQIAVDTTLA